jgi:asparagine synthase (glutamine-hydrolysing)
MSGIVGIYYPDGRPVERSEVENMLNTISHRGPDGFGIWTDGPVGLGHQMLHTTPESLHEKLPLTNRRGDLAITADARIDNREELFRELDLNGRPRETIPDSEVILAAYEKWGERCPEKLLGDFAFAIWDGQKKTVFCARDPIGIRPLFYSFDGKAFYCGSEPRTIYGDSKISKEPNLQLICLYLLNRFDEREETLYRNIDRLPGSHYMVLEKGKIRKGQYWDVDPGASIRCKTDEQYADHFLQLFKQAVKVRLRSCTPVGLTLSGGIDSSSVAATAQLIRGQELFQDNGFESFSLIYDTFPCDERSYIHEVVKSSNLTANYIKYEDTFSEFGIEKNNGYFDIPYSPTLLSYRSIFKRAQEKGIRSVLNGVGGDDLLGSEPDHLTDLLLHGKFYKLIRQFRCDSKTLSRSPRSLFLHYCLLPLIPRRMRLGLGKRFKHFRRNEIPSYFNMNLLKRIGVVERFQEPLPYKKFPTVSQTKIYQGLRFDWNANIAIDMLERLTSHFEIEGRYPYFDRNIMVFLFAVPQQQRWKNGLPKQIVRKSLEGILPEPVRRRTDKPKFTSTLIFEYRYRQSAQIEELIRSSRLVNRGVIHSNELASLFDAYKKGSCDHFTIFLWNFLWLEIFLRSIEEDEQEAFQ